MAGLNNLNSSDFKDILRRLRNLETATPMNNAAVGRSGFEVYDGGTINISNGHLIVNGTATVGGTLNADGTVTLSGTVRVSGPLTITGDTSVSGDFTVTGPTKLNGETDIGGDTTVTGDLNVEGPLDVAGTMDIKGKSTLQNDLEVKGGGKVKVGGMTLDPSIAAGAITFANGAQVFTNGDSIQVFRGQGVLQVENDRASLQWGGKSFSVDVEGRRIPNLPQTTQKPNLYVDSNGYLYRSTAN